MVILSKQILISFNAEAAMGFFSLFLVTFLCPAQVWAQKLNYEPENETKYGLRHVVS